MKSYLVLEDESLVREHVQMEIQKADPGAVVRGYKSVAEMVSGLGDFQPDVAFLDVQLSDGPSGIEGAKVLRTKTRAKIVFLTAFSDQNTLTLAAQVHPEAYLTKPFNPTQLSATIQHLAMGRPSSSGDAQEGQTLQETQSKGLSESFMTLVTRAEGLSSFSGSTEVQKALGHIEVATQLFKEFEANPNVNSYEGLINKVWAAELLTRRCADPKFEPGAGRFVEAAGQFILQLKKYAETNLKKFGL